MIQVACYTILLLIVSYFLSVTAFKIVLIAIALSIISIIALLIICWTLDRWDRERERKE